MFNFSDFQFHDCTLDEVCVEKSKLILYFAGGIFIYNAVNGCFTKSEGCRVVAHIADLEKNAEYEHITIEKFKNNKKKEINFNDFAEQIKRSRMRIYLDYYSPFANAVLFKGLSNNKEIEVTITDIDNLEIL